MLPNENHPLTEAYVRSVSVRSHDALREVSRLIAHLEKICDEVTVAQCKLAAEVLLERGPRAMIGHG